MTFKEYFNKYWKIYLGSVIFIIGMQYLLGHTSKEIFLSTWWYLLGFTGCLMWNRDE